MSFRHLTWFVVAWLASGCDRAQPASNATAGAPSSVAGSGSTSTSTSTATARSGSSGSASGSSAVRQPAPPDIDPAIVIDAAKAGMGFLLEKAEKSERARAKQVEKLDQQIARIQKLLEAGKYDEAELLLVDIYWIPVEPGARSEARFVSTYDAKRTSLAQFIEAKRGRAPVK
jgi:hypothetical protein